MGKIERYQVTKEDMIQAIELAYQGKPIKTICKEIGISLRAMDKLRKTDALFSQTFNRARETGIEALADELIDIHEKIENPIAARLASENYRWLLSKRIPKVYGDKIDINMTQSISVSGALNQARERAQLESGAIKDINEKPEQEDYLGVDIDLIDDDDIFS